MTRTDTTADTRTRTAGSNDCCTWDKRLRFATMRKFNGSPLLPLLFLSGLLPQITHAVPVVGKLTALRNAELDYELFLPAEWSPSTPKAPVLVFLHGRGESGAFDVTNAQSLPLQLIQNTSFIQRCPFIVIVPQCPAECAHSNGWMDSVLSSTTKLITEVLDKYNGDASRVYLAGQSMGGNGAWRYASQQLHLFSAVIVICGYSYPLDGKKLSERLQSTSVGIVHAVDDSVIPVEDSDEMAVKLKASGRTDPAKYWRYAHAPGPPMPEYSYLTGHGSYEIAFRDPELYAWLLQKTCPTCGPTATKWVPIDRSRHRHEGKELSKKSSPFRLTLFLTGIM